MKTDDFYIPYYAWISFIYVINILDTYLTEDICLLQDEKAKLKDFVSSDYEGTDLREFVKLKFATKKKFFKQSLEAC